MKLAEGIARAWLAIERLSRLADGGSESLQQLTGLASRLSDQLLRVERMLGQPADVTLLWLVNGAPRMFVKHFAPQERGTTFFHLTHPSGHAEPPGIWIVARGCLLKEVRIGGKVQGDGDASWLRVTSDDWKLGQLLEIQAEPLGGLRS